MCQFTQLWVYCVYIVNFLQKPDKACVYYGPKFAHYVFCIFAYYALFMHNYYSPKIFSYLHLTEIFPNYARIFTHYAGIMPYAFQSL